LGRYSQQTWSIETCHRVIKQSVGNEKTQIRSAIKQRNHSLLALRAYLRLESHRLRTGSSWNQVKFEIVRGAIRDYLAHPSIVLSTA
jgi:hypothetical protein